MTADDLLNRYSAGKISRLELISQIPACLTSQNADAVLARIPEDLLARFADWMRYQDPKGPFLSMGSPMVPTTEQIILAKRWAETHVR
jgi:hypothetical protein